MKYIRHTKALDELYRNLDELIANINLNERKVIMFGSSKISGMIIWYLEKNKIEVDSIIDNNQKAWGNVAFGKKIYSPEEKLGKFCADVFVLIVSGYQDEMIAQLKEMNYQEKKHFVRVIDLPGLMKDYSFVDRKGYVELTNAQIREGQLRCLKKVKRVCEENGLRYFLSGGTLLGAVRHKGYIPWDDDIDVFIVMKDWKRFDELIKEDDGFAFFSIIGDEDYYDECGLLCDTSTLCDINHFPMQITAGISIDIVPLLGLPDSESEIRKYASELKEQYFVTQNTLYLPDQCKEECLKLYDMMLRYDFDTSQNVGHILGPYYMKEIRPKAWFNNPVYLKFEDEEYLSPNGYHEYLSGIYDDYMKLPPQNKRKGHHYFKAYSLV